MVTNVFGKLICQQKKCLRLLSYLPEPEEHKNYYRTDEKTSVFLRTGERPALINFSLIVNHNLIFSI
jgi:hypothetical protein